MYKIIDISDIEYDDSGEVTYIEYSVLGDMEIFSHSNHQKELLKKYFSENNFPYGKYSITEFDGDTPIKIVGLFFYDENISNSVLSEANVIINGKQNIV